MAWDTSSIKNSLYSMLGLDSSRVDEGRTQQLEQVRTAMLACLQDLDASEVHTLHLRLSYAKDVQTLWYLRSDLMGVLANRKGEATATEEKSIRYDQQLADLLPMVPGNYWELASLSKPS